MCRSREDSAEEHLHQRNAVLGSNGLDESGSVYSGFFHSSIRRVPLEKRVGVKPNPNQTNVCEECGHSSPPLLNIIRARPRIREQRSRGQHATAITGALRRSSTFPSFHRYPVTDGRR